uniref:Ig-like domain-containing protein n=1 Tax=Hucho hucho TaxID=62062 RepID=A0A4W5JKF3_9TELE
MLTHLGQSVSLTCFCQSHLIGVSWYKQTVGQKPLLMASSYHGTENSFYSNIFDKDFTETKRLSVKRGVDICNLTISKTESGDSATYYCCAMEVGEVKFGEGTVLIVKDSGSNSMSVLQQPVSESVKPGDSVTLNCTIHTETCAGEHSVYWFRHGSGESRPGIIYTNADRSDQCEKIPEATQSCFYNLPKRNLSLSDAGTYYCAVASCGEILFGNGTKLDIEDLLGDQSNLPFLIMIIFCLTTTGILSVIVNVILCVRMKRSPCEHCAAWTPFQQSHYGNPHANTSDQQLHGDDDGLNYAGLQFTDKKSTKPRRQRREQREEETIYSDVRYQVRT